MQEQVLDKKFWYYLRIVIFVAVNGVIIYFFIQWIRNNIRWDELNRAILDIPIQAFLAAFVLNYLVLFLYGRRMSGILKVPFRAGFGIVNLGFGFNTILPFRIGELAKMYYSKQIFQIPFTNLGVATLLEKMTDMVIVSFILLFVLLIGSFNFISYKILVGIGMILIALLMFMLIFGKTRFFFLRLFQNNSRIKSIIQAFEDHIINFNGFLIGFLTVLIWITTITSYFLFFRLCFNGSNIGINNAIALLLITVLAVAIPSTPASIGLFEAGMVAYLTQYLNISNEKALSAAFIFHLSSILAQFINLFFVLFIMSKKHKKVEG